MSKENQSGIREFQVSKPPHLWTEREKSFLEEYGLTQEGLTVYKSFNKRFGWWGDYTSPLGFKCHYGCRHKWKVGEEVFEPHIKGLYAATFDNDEWSYDASLLGFLRKDFPPLFLLLMRPENFLSISYTHIIKSSKFLVLDILELKDPRANKFIKLRPLLNGLKGEPLREIGSTARSWDDVIRILSDVRKD